MEGLQPIPEGVEQVLIHSDCEDEGFLNVDENNDDEVITNNQTNNAKISRKLTSEAWEFFDKIDENGVAKAKCKHCNAILSAAVGSGTSHLLKHARKVCPGRHLRLAPGQTQLKVKTEKDGSTILELKAKDKEFDQEFSRKELVNMVVMHEYPLSIVDHIGFRRFVSSLNSSFKMISRSTLKRDVMKMFNQDKRSLKALLVHNESKIAITTDMWTASNQKKGYMVITSHFIDQQWVLRNRTLRFCYVPCPHTKGVIAKVLMDCLSQYSLENKVSSVVVDNCTTNDAMMKILLEKFEKNALMLSGEFLHMRCSAHILNLVVQDGLNVISSGIEKVRECVAFWMSTPKRIEKFEEACRFLNLTSCKRLVLDCKTRWNSTFLMLQTVLPFKDVFSRLKRLNKRMNFNVPSDEDWSLAKVVCEKLEIFYKTTNIFSGRKFVTINLFFRKVCEIKLALRSWLQSDVDVIESMAKIMVEKFDKYWEHINAMLAIATILDPRNKMDCVEFYFNEIYGDEASLELVRIRKVLDKLVVDYQKREACVNGQNSIRTNNKRPAENCVDGEDAYARAKKIKKRKVNVTCEVDHYLEDDPLPEDPEFDILYWWKTNNNYPTMRKIARDILAIPVSTVASESAFSMGGRVVSEHRSRLHSDTVEALMCLQNWIMQDLKGKTKDDHSCSTITDDSDVEVEAQIVDFIDMDLDEDVDDD